MSFLITLYVVFSGGVACSSYLRFLMNQLCDYVEVEMFVPPPKLCSDNGIMIAWNGIEHLKKGGSLVSPEDLDSVHFQVSCTPSEIRKILKRLSKSCSGEHLSTTSDNGFVNSLCDGHNTWLDCHIDPLY